VLSVKLFPKRLMLALLPPEVPPPRCGTSLDLAAVPA